MPALPRPSSSPSARPSLSSLPSLSSAARSAPELLAPATLRHDAAAPPRPWWLAALVAAGWSLAVALVLLGAPAMLVWAADGATAPLADALGAGATTWLVAHGSGMVLDGGPVDLTPLGLTALPLVLLHRAGRWAALASGTASVRGAAQLVAIVVGAYAGVAAALAALSARPDVSVGVGRAALATGALAAIGAGSGAVRGAGVGGRLAERVPRSLREAARGGLVAAAVVLAGGAALVLVALLAQVERVQVLSADLDVGVVGTLLLTALGIGLLPNAGVWAAAVALGPGFALGVGTSFGTGSTRLGAVPALPLLGGLPDSVPWAVGVAALLVPVLGGALAAWLLARRRAAAGRSCGWRRVLLEAAGVAVVAAVLLGVAGLLSGGGLGAGRLSDIGPVSWQVALAALVEVGLGALLAASLLHWRRAGRRPDDAEPAVAEREPERGEELASP